MSALGYVTSPPDGPMMGVFDKVAAISLALWGWLLCQKAFMFRVTSLLHFKPCKKIISKCIQCILFICVVAGCSFSLYFTKNATQRSPLSSTNVVKIQMLKFNYVYVLADLRLQFQTSFTAIHVETGYRNSTGHEKVAAYRWITLLKRTSVFTWSKIAERERKEPRTIETKVTSAAFLAYILA